jgi:hypothetical protein
MGGQELHVFSKRGNSLPEAQVVEMVVSRLCA